MKNTLGALSVWVGFGVVLIGLMALPAAEKKPVQPRKSKVVTTKTVNLPKKPIKRTRPRTPKRVIVDMGDHETVPIRRVTMKTVLRDLELLNEQRRRQKRETKTIYCGHERHLKKPWQRPVIIADVR